MKDNSIGEIISAGTFTHGNDGPDALDEFLRILKPEGLFVLFINSKFFIRVGFKKNFLKLIIGHLPLYLKKLVHIVKILIKHITKLRYLLVFFLINYSGYVKVPCNKNAPF